jgi:hypothetical protein
MDLIITADGNVWQRLRLHKRQTNSADEHGEDRADFGGQKRENGDAGDDREHVPGVRVGRGYAPFQRR